ncbi:MAG: CHAT domain-containing protein [Cyanobacteria bacterium SBLK]|nr:CHAT domain-containing protein [Cyanobacteria bacterium SBLK]
MPTSDDIQTKIEQNGNIYTIEGGLRSRDNLFHSLDEFGLNAGEIADFLATSDIQNILTRIVGGNPSLIDGLIRVTGSNSNLYLINPAGIVFGSNARLNVSGDFFASTATGIGFSDDIFNIFGENNYSNLTGEPLTFEFDVENPAPIVNAGYLSVNTDRNLGLIGGSVINTGTLNTEAGNIIITAVSGTNRVKLSRPESLLSLEIEIPLAEDGTPLPITPLDLPQLLVGAEKQNIATGLTLNPDGEIRTAMGAIASQSGGTAFITGNVEAGNIAGEGGNIGIFGDRVILNNARVDASGSNGGGMVFVGGGERGQGNLPTARYTSIDENSSIRTDAIDRGNGGTIIVWSDEHAEIHGILSTRGGENAGDGGFIETSGKETLQITSTPDASSIFGTGGMWLIDPTDIRICNGCPSSGAVGTSLIDVNQINTALNSNTSVTITTSIGGGDVGNIVQDSNAVIQKTSGTGAPIILFFAHNDIILDGGIQATSGQLYTGIFADGSEPSFVGSSGISSDNSGRVVINGAIDSNGGNVRIYGNNSQANLSAIEINSSIQSRGGIIDIQGSNYSTTANDNSHGVRIDANVSSESGLINIDGSSIHGDGIEINAAIASSTGLLDFEGRSTTGQGVNINANLTTNTGAIDIRGYSTDNDGIDLGSSASIQSNGGFIGLTGISANNDGIDINGQINSAGGQIEIGGTNQTTGGIDDQGVDISGNILSGGGNIAITGTGTAVGIDIAEAIDSSGGDIGLRGISPNGIGVILRETLDSGTGTIGIGSDKLDLSDTNASLTGTGALILRPETPNRMLTLGGTGAADTTYLNATEIDRLQDGFASIRIEDNLSNTAIVQLDDSANFQDRLVIQNVAELIGPDSNRNWTIAGNNQGAIAGYSQSVSFNNLAILRGGSGQDMFAFDAGANFNGIIDGGAGFDTLDYTNYGSAATVNLAANTATGTLGVFNFEETVNANIVNPAPLAPSAPSAPSAPPAPSASSTSLSFLTPLSSHSPLALFPTPGEDDRQALNGLDRQQIAELFDSGDLETAIALLDRYYSQNFLRYLGKADDASATSLADIQRVLQQMERETGTTAATLYVFSRPEQLDLILVPPTSKPIRYSLPEVPRYKLLARVRDFQQAIAHPLHRRNTRYLDPAQNLYNWLISPAEKDLQRFNVETLMFVLDDGLRTLPIPALHDGKRFAIENYSIALVPSLHLIPTHYTDLRDSAIVAMGMSEFENDEALPAVPVEVNAIAEEFNAPDTFLNETFTLNTLQRESARQEAQILHLATHGQFQPGIPSESYIQLWDDRLNLAQMKSLNWGAKGIELLVLSACRTALGDETAEYGFAGLSVQSGASSAVASLWYANDAGTLALMTEFYRQLRERPTKAQALQQAQIALIRGDVRLEKEERRTDGKEIGNLVSSFGRVTLPPELADLGDRRFQHPYYWAGFTLIGSPW